LGPFGGSGAFRSPRTDVTDMGAWYKMWVRIPGIPKEKLDLRGPTGQIRGESGTETEPKDEQYLRRERTYFGYYWALEFPDAVIDNEATAKVVNGNLGLDLPRPNPTPSEAQVKVHVAQGGEGFGMVKLDEERVELERPHRFAQGTELGALLFEDRGINAVEASEVEPGLRLGLVGDTTGRGHGPVVMAPSRLPPQDHTGACVGDAADH